MKNGAGESYGAYRIEERAFIKVQIVVFAVVTVLCITSRAPEFLKSVSIASIGVEPTVGDVITLGPGLILALMLWRKWEATHLHEIRMELATNGALPVRKGRKPWLLFFLLLPALGIFFLFRQYIFEIREFINGATTQPGCGAFGRIRLFWDITLLSSDGMQVRYCFGRDRVQDRSFYIFPPIQTWAYLIVAGWIGYLGYRIWRDLTWQPSGQSGAITSEALLADVPAGSPAGTAVPSEPNGGS